MENTEVIYHKQEEFHWLLNVKGKCSFYCIFEDITKSMTHSKVTINGSHLLSCCMLLDIFYNHSSVCSKFYCIPPISPTGSFSLCSMYLSVLPV